MPKRPTLQDVADAAGLSLATVSYALRGERGSDATVAHVRETAQRLGFHANPIAAALARGRSRTVAVLCGSTRDHWQQSLAAGLARELMAQGRHAIVADADGRPDQEAALLDQLLEQQPDGLLVAPLDPFGRLWEDVAAERPVVAIGDRLSLAPSAGAVVFDNAAGMAAVFEHLAGLGHRRVVVVLPQRPSTPDRPAEELVASQSRRHGLTTVLVHTPPATADPDLTTAHLADALADALDVADPPTAAFCLTDSFACATLRAAARLGLSVPGDLSVVGFEDIELADLVGPGLTTVSWGDRTVVPTAVQQLLAVVDGQAEPSTTTVAPRLVVRGTTGPA